MALLSLHQLKSDKRLELSLRKLQLLQRRKLTGVVSLTEETRLRLNRHSVLMSKRERLELLLMRNRERLELVTRKRFLGKLNNNRVKLNSLGVDNLTLSARILFKLNRLSDKTVSLSRDLAQPHRQLISLVGQNLHLLSGVPHLRQQVVPLLPQVLDLRLRVVQLRQKIFLGIGQVVDLSLELASFLLDDLGNHPHPHDAWIVKDFVEH